MDYDIQMKRQLEYNLVREGSKRPKLEENCMTRTTYKKHIYWLKGAENVSNKVIYWLKGKVHLLNDALDWLIENETRTRDIKSKAKSTAKKEVRMNIEHIRGHKHGKTLARAGRI